MVSIHAPVKGATYTILNPIPKTCVSIHAPVKGATNVDNLAVKTDEFQSTLP